MKSHRKQEPSASSEADAFSILSATELISVIRANNNLSDIIDKSELMRELSGIIFRITYADKCMILTKNEDGLYAATKCGKDIKSFTTISSLALDECEDIPKTLVRRVILAGKVISVGNAAQTPHAAENKYIRDRNTGSILCLPIMYKDISVGAVYIEKLLNSAFTSQMQEMIKAIASHAAFCIHNASITETINMEIQERRREEKILLASEERYRNIIEQMEDTYCEVNLRGNITYISPSIAKISGYSRDELIGFSFGKLSSPDDAGKLIRYYSEVFRTGITGKPFVWKMRRKDGNASMIEMVVSLSKDKKGDTTGFCGIGRDVTEKFKADVSNSDILRHSVQIAEKVKHDSLAEISHEIRTPLNAIIGLSGLALKTDLNVKQQDYLNKIENAAKALLEATNRKFNYSETPLHLEEEPSGAQIEGKKVLLVEDNPINQQVAREILEQAGLVVKTVNNGKKAVEALEKATYDLVLMDIQMPVMDGYEATRLIRLNPAHIDLPIIALTAHAVPGDREECVAAGMNDYLTKPIDTERLFPVLMRWIALNPNAASENKAEDQKQAGNKFQDELPGIDVATGIKRIGGNREFYIELLNEFIRDYSSSPEEIVACMELSDIEKAERLAHTVRGIAGNLSANDLFQASLELEKAIKSDSGIGINRTLDKYRNAFGVVAASVKTLTSVADMSKTADSDALQTSASLDVAAIRPLIKRMSILLEENDMLAEEMLNDLRQHLKGKGFDRDIKKLGKFIGNLDFEEAQQYLNSFSGKIGM